MQLDAKRAGFSVPDYMSKLLSKGGDALRVGARPSHGILSACRGCFFSEGSGEIQSFNFEASLLGG